MENQTNINKSILSLAVENPELAKEWHPTKNDTFTPQTISHKSNRKVWWIGSCGHEWEAIVNNRMNGASCPFCSNRKVLYGFNDLETTHPELLEDWHPFKNDAISPSEIINNSGKVLWWKCRNGHEWSSSVTNRTHGSGCPTCSKLLKKQKDDMDWEQNFQLAEEYYFKNNNLEIPTTYVTENGFRLGTWISRQRRKYNQSTLDTEKIEKLDQINMVWSVYR